MKFLFSIMFFATLLMGNCCQADISAPGTRGALQDEPFLTINHEIRGESTFYHAVLFDQCEQELGKISFSYDQNTRAGYIQSLHITPSKRKQSFGSILLTFALATLTECKCTIVTWLASPFNLREGEDARAMLPKLVAFYQRHGAIVTQMREYNADISYYTKQ